MDAMIVIAAIRVYPVLYILPVPTLLLALLLVVLILILLLLVLVLLVPDSAALLLELATVLPHTFILTLLPIVFPSSATRFRPVVDLALTLIFTAAMPDDDAMTIPDADAAFRVSLPIQPSAPVPMVIM